MKVKRTWVFLYDKTFIYKTPLFEAIKSKNIDIINTLIDHNADVNEVYVQDDDRYYESQIRETPLLEALQSGNKEIVKLLIERKADVKFFFIEKTSVQHLINNDIINDFSIFSHFIKNSEKDTKNELLMELILIDDNVEEEKERMSIILNRDIGLPMLNPEILRNMGYTVNSYVELLINSKADVNVLDQHKMSPLLYASMYGKSKVMKILIDL